MKMTDKQIELCEWFNNDCNNGFIPQMGIYKPAFMAKYWIAKEMATDICRREEEFTNEYDYIFGNGYVSGHTTNLTQILKKEWFR